MSLAATPNTAGDGVLAVIVAGDGDALAAIGGRPAIARVAAVARSAGVFLDVRVVVPGAVPAAALVAWADSAGLIVEALDGGPMAGLTAVAERILAAAEASVRAVVAVDAAAALLTAAELTAVATAVRLPGTGAALAVAALPAGLAVSGPVGEAGAVVVATTLAAVSRDGAAADPVRVALPFDRLRRISTPADRLIAAQLLIELARTEGLALLPARPAALVMDFDGVFTDNAVIVDQNGIESVRCSRSDGLRLEQLRGLGLPMLVLSKERNPVVAARCAKLKLECLQAIDDKGPALQRWCQERSVDPRDVIYVGNDSNDLPAFAAVGCAVAVADAWPEALAAADLVLMRPGGNGALRELCDLIVARLGAAA